MARRVTKILFFVTIVLAVAWHLRCSPLHWAMVAFPSGAFAPSSGSRHLDAAALDQLAQAFDHWTQAGRGPATRRSRGRARLVFLLLRHTGAKLGEVLALDEAIDFTWQPPAVRLGQGEAQRQVPLPQEVAREVRRSLEDAQPTALRGQFFRLDQGYVRRVFQTVAAAAGLPRELSSPSVLRRSRAVELLRDGLPVAVVQNLLGYGSSTMAAGLLEFSDEEMRRLVSRQMQREKRRRTSARNSFYGQVADIRRGDIQSEVALTTLDQATITAVITNGSLESLGLQPGQYVTALVKAPWVLLERPAEGVASSAENTLAGTVAAIHAGQLAVEVVVAVSDATEVCALLTRQRFEALGLDPGDPVRVLFAAFAVILTVD